MSITHAEQEALKAERAAGKKALKQILSPISGYLTIGRVLAVISGILAIAPYVALLKLGNLLYTAYDAGAKVDEDAVWTVVFWLISLFALRLFINAIALGITHFADIKMGALVKTQMIERMSTAPLGWFSKTNAGKVRKAIQDDILMVHALVAHQPVDVTQAIVTPVALLILAFTVDWRLGLLTIASLPIYIAANIWMTRGMGEKTVEMDAHLGRVSSMMVELFMGISVVKAFGIVGQAHKRYQDAADDFSHFYMAWVTPMLRASAVAEASISIPIVLAINLGGGMAMAQAGWVTPPDVLTTTLVALVLPLTIRVVSTMAWSYQLAGAAALRVVQTLKVPALKAPAQDADMHGHAVEFDDVSFSYGDTLAVDHVSLRLEENTVTALIGASGSGKSTLATLLARFNDPDSGRITIGGADIRELSTAALYRTVSFVLQDPQLLRISLRENIRLARPNATDEQVRAAARKAQILDTIEQLPKGLDTIFGDDTHLSGGQSQRIAIARAILADAPVLILDEATAFADPESEARIQAALNALVQGRTVLVIAHRPESVLGADQIVVLERGRVAAQGQHEQLLHNPVYQQLLAASQPSR